jgi:hypothetical protein
MDSLSRISGSAKEFGEEIAELLNASTFSESEKEAWAALIPGMTIPELERLRGILIRQAEGKVAQEFEQTALELKAASMRHDFAVSHAEHDAMKGIDEILEELEDLER